MVILWFKETEHSFNQIPDDQGLEHVNRTGKESGGLIGITRNESALNKWCLTINERAKLAKETKLMFGMENEGDDDDWSHKDIGPSRIKRDNDDVDTLVHQLEKFQPFQATKHLLCVTTGDVIPDDIQQDLLSADQRGIIMLKEFVEDRYVNKTVKLHASITKKKSKTFKNLHNVKIQKDKQKKPIVTADQDLFRRVIVAGDRGQSIDIDEMLQRELSSVPLALACVDGTLRQTNKAQLASILKDGVTQPTLNVTDTPTCTIIDGMALVQAIGKPPNATTFGDLADVFTTCVTSNFSNHCTRIDIVFDTYDQESIKGLTRNRRAAGNRTIRRIITNRESKLPGNWKAFIDLGENKADLTNFLSNELCDLILRDDQELVVAGGFLDRLTTISSVNRNVDSLSANHEEADTRIILHAIDAKEHGFERTVVICKDTDVLLLLLAFSTQLCPEIWMKVGTKAKPCYIKVHDIEVPDNVRSALMAFHSITGCDTTSQFSGIGKKSSWKVFLKMPELLCDFGTGLLPSDQALLLAEVFVCKLYEPSSSATSIHTVRCFSFRKSKANIDNLPPTKDALAQHLKRAHFQALIWNQSNVPMQTLPSPVQSGWYLLNKSLVPKLTTKNSVSDASLQLFSCNCTECGYQCRTTHCKCTHAGLSCSHACACSVGNWCKNPSRRRGDASDTDSD